MNNFAVLTKLIINESQTFISNNPLDGITMKQDTRRDKIYFLFCCDNKIMIDISNNFAK